MPTRICVWHFGPDVRFAGGMSSVIVTLVAQKVGVDEAHAVATWWPGGHLRNALRTARAARRILTLPRGAVVHVHISFRGSLVRKFPLLVLAQARGLPRVVTVHGHDFGHWALGHRTLAGTVLRRASVITVLNERDLRAVRELAPGTPVIEVPNGVDLDPDAGPASQTDEIVLFAGAVGTRKGADVLARAWPRVRAARPHAQCVIVGTPTELTLDPSPGLELRGTVSHDEVLRLIRQARVVALPSQAEALPMILLEAMAAARPFVATEVGGVGSLAAAGRLIEVGDDEGLAQALVQFLASPELSHRTGRAGRELCAARFATTTVGAAYREVYETAIATA